MSKAIVIIFYLFEETFLLVPPNIVLSWLENYLMSRNVLSQLLVYYLINLVNFVPRSYCLDWPIELGDQAYLGELMRWVTLRFAPFMVVLVLVLLLLGLEFLDILLVSGWTLDTFAFLGIWVSQAHIVVKNN